MSNSPFISNCTADAIRDAALALKAGHLVAFPTETVYGLGADARNPEAIKRIYEVKGRPTDHPLIVHISSLNQLDKWAIDIPEYAIKLARKFWPGPMTLILKRGKIAEDFITGGQNTIGLRVPSDSIAVALITEFEKISNSAIAAPSANRFGQVSATSSMAVSNALGSLLGNKDLILNGGLCSVGIESTIISCVQSLPEILRPGAVTREMIETVTPINIYAQSEIRSPGSFINHYSPRTRVFLNTSPTPGDGFLALSDVKTPEGAIRLASPKDSDEFAIILYESFRRADEMNIEKICVITPPQKGIGIAIMDRLNKSKYKN
jgi:L-threonylcarbamoyladenylate synthase